jgi:choice-of-anchor B domain-containing protein
LGRLPQQSVTSIWHDIKGYKNYIVVGSEAEGHGIQVFDMMKLVDIDPAQPKNFSTTSDLTGWYGGLPIGASHNLVAHEEKDYVVAVGSQPRNSTCRSGLIFIDMTDPSNPTSPGCAAQDGYVHDAQCVTYKGPDKRFEGRDVCYGFNEDTLTIYDVTDRSSGFNTSKVISRTPYVGATYTHQGWLLDEEWQQYLFSDDELDELDEVEPAADGRSVMYIWDISDLTAPVNTVSISMFQIPLKY